MDCTVVYVQFKRPNFAQEVILTNVPRIQSASASSYEFPRKFLFAFEIVSDYIIKKAYDPRTSWIKRSPITIDCMQWLLDLIQR